jgi:hypothetical protein
MGTIMIKSWLDELKAKGDAEGVANAEREWCAGTHRNQIQKQKQTKNKKNANLKKKKKKTYTKYRYKKYK